MSTQPKYNWHRYTLAEAFERLQKGEPPWGAIGDFLEDWRNTLPADRLELVSHPIPQVKTGEQQQWAALCAGIAEQLCRQDNLSIPPWALDEQYILREPWYLSARGERFRQYQAKTTPEVFKRRNVLGGDRLLSRV